jgi:hypothetical protein
MGSSRGFSVQPSPSYKMDDRDGRTGLSRTTKLLRALHSMAATSNGSPRSMDIKDITVDHTASESHHETGSTAKGELATLDAGYSESDVIVDLPPAEGRRALRKVDYRLVPLLAILYLVAFIDRSNMQVAVIRLMITTADPVDIVVMRELLA